MVAEPAVNRVPGARRDPRDRGFTLLETIVVVLLVAVVASVMVAVIAVILKTAPSTEARVDNSNSYQRLMIRLQRDAASTPPDRFEPHTIPPLAPAWSCAGISPSLVEMSWSLDGTAYVAGYRLEPDGSGQQISRYTCSGPDTGSVFPSPMIEPVTARLYTATAVPISGGSEVVGIRIDLTLCLQLENGADCTQPEPGPPIAVEASSRNPAKTLPPP
jgi:prepilin-type N-terminal cleavage/methylation domain-containing protein